MNINELSYSYSEITRIKSKYNIDGILESRAEFVDLSLKKYIVFWTLMDHGKEKPEWEMSQLVEIRPNGIFQIANESKEFLNVFKNTKPK